MSRMLYTYEQEMPTVGLFRDVVNHRVERYGWDVRFKQLMEITPEDLEWCDVVEFIRPNDPYSLHLARRARKMGRFVVAYYDDDLYDLPENMTQPPWRRKNILRILRACNLIHSSSQRICDKYRIYTTDNRTCTSGTSVDSKEIKRVAPLTGQEKASGKVKLVYAANSGHVVFFNQFILPIMPHLCQKFGDKISMTFMGVRPDLSAYEDQMEIIYLPGMPLAEYRQKIQEGGYDIGLSPLTTDEFTKCKYFNKFIEYTMAGIVGMYSNTEPYTYVVKQDVNGFLVNDDPADWLDSLSRVIDDAVLRNRCACNAQDMLLTDFTPERVAQKEVDELPERENYTAPKDRVCGSLLPYKLLYKLMRVVDKFYFLCYYLFHGGIPKVIQHLRG